MGFMPTIWSQSQELSGYHNEYPHGYVIELSAE